MRVVHPELLASAYAMRLDDEAGSECLGEGGSVVSDEDIQYISISEPDVACWSFAEFLNRFIVPALGIPKEFMAVSTRRTLNDH